MDLGSSFPITDIVIVHGAPCEWIPIVLGMPEGSVLCPLLFILYFSKMFELMENKL